MLSFADAVALSEKAESFARVRENGMFLSSGMTIVAAKEEPSVWHVNYYDKATGLISGFSVSKDGVKAMEDSPMLVPQELYPVKVSDIAFGELDALKKAVELSSVVSDRIILLIHSTKPDETVWSANMISPDLRSTMINFCVKTGKLVSRSTGSLKV